MQEQSTHNSWNASATCSIESFINLFVHTTPFRLLINLIELLKTRRRISDTMKKWVHCPKKFCRVLYLKQFLYFDAFFDIFLSLKSFTIWQPKSIGQPIDTDTSPNLNQVIFAGDVSQGTTGFVTVPICITTAISLASHFYIPLKKNYLNNK